MKIVQHQDDENIDPGTTFDGNPELKRTKKIDGHGDQPAGGAPPETPV